MSERFDNASYEKFLRGEIYTNGWKSEWRKEMERRRAEDAAKQGAGHDGR